MTSTELTPREREVLTLAQRDLSNEAIAEQLGITQNAVRYHLKELHSKLETDGDRGTLSRWRHALLPALALPSGVAAAKVTVGAAVGLFALGAATVALTWSDADDTGNVLAVDGHYANGCPARLIIGEDLSLAEIDDLYRGAFGHHDELARLNPEFVAVVVPAGTEVRVPYNSNNTCVEVDETVASSSG